MEQHKAKTHSFSVSEKAGHVKAKRPHAALILATAHACPTGAALPSATQKSVPPLLPLRYQSSVL